jgi:copper chaperone CopZ
VGTILRSVEGVLDVKVNTITYTATVIFAPEKTSTEVLIRALQKGDYEVLGRPRFLE